MPPSDYGELARLLDAIGDDVGLLLLVEALIDTLLLRQKRRQVDPPIQSST